MNTRSATSSIGEALASLSGVQALLLVCFLLTSTIGLNLVFRAHRKRMMGTNDQYRYRFNPLPMMTNFNRTEWLYFAGLASAAFAFGILASNA